MRLRRRAGGCQFICIQEPLPFPRTRHATRLAGPKPPVAVLRDAIVEPVADNPGDPASDSGPPPGRVQPRSDTPRRLGPLVHVRTVHQDDRVESVRIETVGLQQPPSYVGLKRRKPEGFC